MKMDLPSFNGHVQIEEFLDWIIEVEQFFKYMEIREDKHMKLVAYKLKGRNACLVGQPTTTLYPPEEGLYMHLAKKEKADGRMIFTTRLLARVVQAISRVHARFQKY